ncbi:MAG: hypothetical protein methR_P2592 [Methyloprofundus sp.]|nr:MAG: hypothetical protein methR_P2592 [Methyloprofundus sp.]
MAGNQRISEEKPNTSWFKEIGIKNSRNISNFGELLSRILQLSFVYAWVCLFLVVLLPKNWIVELERDFYDKAMIELARTDNVNSLYSFVLVDINERAYKELSYYDTFPPENMAMYIKNLVNSKAKLAIIDIDISHQVLTEKNAELAKAIREYANNPDNPQLLLVRQIDGDFLNSVGELVPTIYDEIVEKSLNVHWVSASYLNAKDSAITRYHQLWVAACRNNRLVVLPSVHILANELLSPDKPPSLQKKIKEVISFYKGLCVSGERLSAILLKNLYQDLDNKIGLGNDINNKRILYLYSPSLPIVYLPSKPGDQEPIPLVDTYEATGFLTKEKSFLVDKLANKIVILGASFGNSKDFFYTPLLRMPGSVIIINSVHSILHYGHIRSATSFEILSVSFVFSIFAISFIFLLSWFFSGIKNKKSIKNNLLLSVALESVPVFLLIWLILKLWKFFLPILLSYGIWVNIMLPLSFLLLFNSKLNHSSLKFIKISIIFRIFNIFFKRLETKYKVYKNDR